jgi:universal stress protein A
MTLTISRILVPLDFSSHAQQAMDYAAALAGSSGASLHLLNVVEPLAAHVLAGESYVMLPEIMDSMVDDAKRQLAEYRDCLPPGTRSTSEVIVGTPAMTIVQTAADRKCDLIVMGTHGRTGLAHLLMGSVAERVTRLAPCPVLTVRPLKFEPARVTSVPAAGDTH